MSFILDALKKSEQERRQGEIPDLQTPQEIPTKRSSGRVWVYLLAAILLVNAVLAAWLLWPRKPEPSPRDRIAASLPTSTAVGPAPGEAGQAPPQVVAPNPEPTPASVPKPPPPVPAATPPTKVLPAATPPTKVLPAATPPTKENRPVPSLMELTPGDRARLPAIDLQLHFYTAQAERRMVRLNNANFREGDKGGEGITVVEITPEGVVVDFAGIRFLYPARKH